MHNLPELTVKARKFLAILKMFDGKQINLKQYAMMLGLSRRRVRMLISELRTKGYIKVSPENMKIHKTKACRYIFLDGWTPKKEEVITIKSDILERLGVDQETLK